MLLVSLSYMPSVTEPVTFCSYADDANEIDKEISMLIFFIKIRVPYLNGLKNIACNLKLGNSL